jgi:hypothetical protein
MGHYTGIAINIKLRPDITPEQIAILHYMTFNKPEKSNTPPPHDRPLHPLFEDDRWRIALSCQSAYLNECERMQPPQGERFRQLSDGRWSLRAAASTKSYGLPELLLSWLVPLVDPSEYGRVCGQYRYEYTAPTSFGFKEGGFFKNEPNSSIDRDGYDSGDEDLYVDMEA